MNEPEDILLADILKEPGVYDIRMKQAKLRFAMALLSERNGFTAEAKRFLDEAVHIEALGNKYFKEH